jgi:indole-3-glycerol phosphate synthase
MSVSKQAKQRGEILDAIMRYHREQLPKIMRATPMSDLRALASIAPEPVDFAAALQREGVSLIAECKKASPSRGLMAPNYDAVRLAKAYMQAGASAISVLTDARHFQGSLEDLRDVREALDATRKGRNVPVLRKDFIFHEYQIYEARAAGADAVLLIAAVLGAGDMKDLLAVVHDLGMNALLEVNRPDELEKVLPLNPRVVGVNNRNLQTFEVDFENTARLRDRIPEGIAVVAESGIRSGEDVRRLAQIGVDAILVGESLVRSRDPQSAAKALVEAGRRR